MLYCASILTYATLMITNLFPPKASSANLREVTDPKYKPGQVWSYQTRPGEDASTLTVLRVEEAPEKKRIVHIRVDRIQLKNCAGGPGPDTAGHMPFAREALDASVIKVLRTGDVPDYKKWLQSVAPGMGRRQRWVLRNYCGSSGQRNAGNFYARAWLR